MSDPVQVLNGLEGRQAGSWRLQVECLGRSGFFDQQDFALHLVGTDGRVQRRGVFQGRYNMGRPSTYVPGWIDGEFFDSAGEDAGDPESGGGLFSEIAEHLGGLIPAGGRFWLAYEGLAGEGVLRRETRSGLFERLPLITTPLGYLLFRADCWIGMRDWDIPEGGMEGSRKLQGNKALDDGHASNRAKTLVEALESFLTQSPASETARRAQARVNRILPILSNYV